MELTGTQQKDNNPVSRWWLSNYVDPDVGPPPPKALGSYFGNTRPVRFVKTGKKTGDGAVTVIIIIIFLELYSFDVDFII